jgi:hypothetical protein
MKTKDTDSKLAKHGEDALIVKPSSSDGLGDIKE